MSALREAVAGVVDTWCQMLATVTPTMQVALIDALLEELAILGVDETVLSPMHVFEWEADGSWSLQHPLACRPDLLSCPVQHALDEQRPHIRASGRFHIWLDASGQMCTKPADLR